MPAIFFVHDPGIDEALPAWDLIFLVPKAVRFAFSRLILYVIPGVLDSDPLLKEYRLFNIHPLVIPYNEKDHF